MVDVIASQDITPRVLLRIAIHVIFHVELVLEEDQTNVQAVMDNSVRMIPSIKPVIAIQDIIAQELWIVFLVILHAQLVPEVVKINVFLAWSIRQELQLQPTVIVSVEQGSLMSECLNARHAIIHVKHVMELALIIVSLAGLNRLQKELKTDRRVLVTLHFTKLEAEIVQMYATHIVMDV